MSRTKVVYYSSTKGGTHSTSTATRNNSMLSARGGQYPARPVPVVDATLPSEAAARCRGAQRPSCVPRTRTTAWNDYRIKARPRRREGHTSPH